MARRISFSGLLHQNGHQAPAHRLQLALAVLEFLNETPPAGDTTPPSVPTNLSATAVSTSAINLTWDASTDNVGVQGYRVFRDGEQIASVASTTLSYGDTGLAASTTYSYTVNAYDAAGNQSAQSSSSSATTEMICATEDSPFGLDGSAITAPIVDAESSGSVDLTTTQDNDVVMVLEASNGGSANFTVSDADDLNWQLRNPDNSAGFFEWYAVANCPLSSDVISVTSKFAGNFFGINAFGVSGASTSTPFDINGSLPASSATSTISLSTSNANDFIFAALRDFDQSVSPLGSGWATLSSTTDQYGQNYYSEYQIASSTQSSLMATFLGQDSGTEMIGDAIQAAQ